MPDNPLTLYESWNALIQATCRLIWCYAPWQVFFAGFVVGFGVCGLLSVVIGKV